MLHTPIRQAKEGVVPSGVPTAEAKLITTASAEPNLIMLDRNTSSLRCAATALLVFSLFCVRPCPSSWAALLGVLAAVLVLCSTSRKVLCRSRFARFLSFVVLIFAGYRVISLTVSYRAGMPLHVSEKVHEQCIEIPTDTFAWAHKQLMEHNGLRKISILSRHMHDGISTAPAFLVSTENASAQLVAADDPTTWSQPEMCSTIAHVATSFAKLTIVISAITHFFLLLAAAAVIKRTCRLRCAAYRAGLLTWKCGDRCKSKCVRTEPDASVKLPAAAKEMA